MRRSRRRGSVGSSRQSVHLDFIPPVHLDSISYIRFIQNFFIPPVHLDSSYLWFIQTSYLHLIQTEIHTSGSSRLHTFTSSRLKFILLVHLDQYKGQVWLAQCLLVGSSYVIKLKVSSVQVRLGKFRLGLVRLSCLVRF